MRSPRYARTAQAYRWPPTDARGTCTISLPPGDTSWQEVPECDIRLYHKIQRTGAHHDLMSRFELETFHVADRRQIDPPFQVVDHPVTHIDRGDAEPDGLRRQGIDSAAGSHINHRRDCWICKFGKRKHSLPLPRTEVLEGASFDHPIVCMRLRLEMLQGAGLVFGADLELGQAATPGRLRRGTRGLMSFLPGHGPADGAGG